MAALVPLTDPRVGAENVAALDEVGVAPRGGRQHGEHTERGGQDDVADAVERPWRPPVSVSPYWSVARVPPVAANSGVVAVSLTVCPALTAMVTVSPGR